MCHTWGHHDLEAFQFHRIAVGIPKEAGPTAEKDRNQMNMEFIQQSSSHILLYGCRAAADSDIFVSCGSSCLSERALDPVGHEGKRRAAFLDERGSWRMCQYVDRQMKGWVLSPGVLAHIKHPFADNDRAFRAKFQKVPVRPVWLNDPLMELRTTIAHRILDPDIWAGTVPIQRDGGATNDALHDYFPFLCSFVRAIRADTAPGISLQNTEARGQHSLLLGTALLPTCSLHPRLNAIENRRLRAMQETADKNYSAACVLLAGPDTIHLSLDLQISEELRATLETEKAAAQEADKINAVHCPDWLGAQVLPPRARGLTHTHHLLQTFAPVRLRGR